MTERERNEVVLDELFGHHNFSDMVIDNLLIDWDKAFTHIFYIKKSKFFENKGEIVYIKIRETCEKYLDWFKEQIEGLQKRYVEE